MQTFLLALILLVVTLFIYSVIAMLVWNLVIPSVFVGGPQIDLFQAFGLTALGHLLSGGSSSSSSSK
jgi:hypothetical protein